jgi:hypothetical protein
MVFRLGRVAEASRISVVVEEGGPTIVTKQKTGLKIAGNDDDIQILL